MTERHRPDRPAPAPAAPTPPEPPGLVAAVVAGRPDAASRLQAALAAATDPADRAALLDPLAAAAGGSAAALEVLLAAIQRQRLALVTIHRLIVDPHDAEEVEQDVLINVTRSIARYRGDARFTTWLHTLVRNVAIDFLRRRRETASLEAAAGLSTGGRLSSMIASRAVVQDAVADLDQAYRLPVTLRDVEQLSYAEIADRLDLPLNTVKSRIHRGRALLAGRIDRELDPELGLGGPGGGATGGYG
ncbi:MAG: sigma-70 family RNA polymerase sigma factor [Acidimicrobiales bacterium]